MASTPRQMQSETRYIVAALLTNAAAEIAKSKNEEDAAAEIVSIFSAVLVSLDETLLETLSQKAALLKKRRSQT